MTDTHDDFHAALREGGYRLTPQRQLVLEAVAKLEHATPDAIAAEVQRTLAAVNLSTVYRTLDLLEELGLVTHSHLGHASTSYHLTQDADHVHLVCRQCGEVQNVDSHLADAFAGSLKGSFGFVADVHHFAVFGRCAHCSGLENGATNGVSS